MDKLNLNSNRVGDFNKLTQQQQAVYLSQLPSTPVVCAKCGNSLFEERVQSSVVSALLSPTGQQIVLRMPILVCDKCGTPLEDDNITTAKANEANS